MDNIWKLSTNPKNIFQDFQDWIGFIYIFVHILHYLKWNICKPAVNVASMARYRIYMLSCWEETFSAWCFIALPYSNGSLDREKVDTVPSLPEAKGQHVIYDKMRSEYLPTFQCTKRVKTNLMIPLQTLEKYTSNFFLHIPIAWWD